MEPEDLSVTDLKQSHDTQLVLGGGAKEVTKVRVYLGKHGPFSWTFPRDVTPQVIGDAIRAKQAELRMLAAIT